MPTYKDHLKLHFIIFIWGFTGVLGALIILPSDALVWYRLVIAIAGLGFFLIYKKVSFAIERKWIIRLLGTGFLIALHWVLFFEAIKVSNVSIALACFASTSLFAAFLEPLIFRRSINIYELLLAAIAFVGIYVIFRVEGQYSLGIIFSVLSAFTGALFTVINGRIIEAQDSMLISFYELVGGFLGLTIYLLVLLNGTFELPLPVFSDVVYLFILGGVCTAYAFAVSVDLMKKVSPFTMSISTNLEPVYAIILALLIFGEKEEMTPEFYYGAVLVIGTVFGNIWLKRKNK